MSIDQNTAKERLVEAGMEVFAEKGYDGATVADICHKADVNVASINYYFGSKEQLYLEVWHQAFLIGQKVYPTDGGLDRSSPADERLFAFIRAKVFQMLNSGKLGCAGKILSNEIGRKTDILKDIRKQVITPMATYLEEIVSEILGKRANPKKVKLCTMSIIHQCLVLGIMRAKGHLGPLQIFGNIGSPSELTEENLEEISRHIYEFSLAGIKRIAEVETGK